MRTLLLLLVLAPQLMACSKTKHIPWSEAMAVWFGNAAAQPTDPPRKHWTKKEEDLFLKRLGYADLVVLGEVRSVGTFTKYEDPRQVTLTFLPLHTFYGDLETRVDERGELVLKLANVALDFRRAVQVQRFLPGKRYILVLKEKPTTERGKPKGSDWKASLWRPPPKPKPIYRWALYRPERALLRQIRDLYQLLKRKKK
jgi:hypothetical protein